MPPTKSNAKGAGGSRVHVHFRPLSTVDDDFDMLRDNGSDEDGTWGLRETDTQQAARSRQATGLLITCFIIIALMIANIVVIVIYSQLDTGVCYSSQCVQTAGVMLSKMNPVLNPCDNFYLFACGGKIADAASMPPDKPKWDALAEIGLRNLKMLKKSLEAVDDEFLDSTSAITLSSVQKARIFYETCMNRRLQEDQGIEPLTKMIVELTGEWPFQILPEGDESSKHNHDLTNRESASSGNGNRSNYYLENLVSRVHLLGQEALFRLYIAPHPSNSSINSVYISQGGLTFPPDVYTGDLSAVFHASYVRCLTELFIVLGVEHSSATRLASDCWHLEVLLSSQFESDNSNNAELAYDMVTVGQLQALFGTADNFDFQVYLEGVFQSELSADLRLIVLQSKYLKRVAHFVTTHSKQTLTAYALWQAVKPFLVYLPSSLRLLRDQLLEIIYDVKPRGQWEECVSCTDLAFPLVTGALFVNASFTPQAGDKAGSLLEDIKASLLASVQQSSWLDETSRQRVLDKLLAVQHTIGYPAIVLDPARLDLYYSQVNVSNDNAFANAVAMSRFSTRRKLSQVGLPVDDEEWYITPTSANAYYSATRNAVVFPAGILQAPIFYTDTVPAIIYGSTGMIMGHELSHALDTKGRWYDERGNVGGVLTNASNVALNNYVQCSIQQHSNSSDDSDAAILASTMNENLADIKGLNAAYNAFNTLQQERGAGSHTLPGLNMTSTQLFFLSYAQLWCTQYSRTYERVAVLTDTHPADEFRVNSVLSHQPQFAEAFQCSAGRMNVPSDCGVF